MLKADNKTDHKEVKVTLDGEFTEEELAELADATITLTDADGKAITATFKDMDTDGKVAIFEAAEDLEDAKVYTVTSELFEDTEFTAKVADEKIVAIDTETTGINKLSPTIHLTAENQYGEDATKLLPKVKKADSTNKEQKETVKITGTLNGNLPLTDADFSYAEGVITVTNDTIFAKEGNKVSITVEITEEVIGEDGKQSTVTIAKNTFDYTISEEADELELTTIKNIEGTYYDDSAEEPETKGKESEVVKPNYTVELTADLRDQFGNAFNFEENDPKDIRWVVTEGKEFLEKPEVSQDTGATVTYKAKSPGKVVITAYHLASGAQKSYEFEIQKTTINELKLTKESEFNSPIHNKEETTAGTLTVNEGATLTADLVDFKVEEKDENGKWVAVAKDVVNPVAKDVKGEGLENLQTTVTVKPEKSGEYKVTPFVKGTDGKEISAQASEFTFTSAPNQAITKIEVAEVKPEVLKVVAEGQTQHAIEIPVKFYNKHGEEIIANQEDKIKETTIAVKSIATDIVKDKDENVKIVDKKDENGKVTSQVLSIKPEKAGDAVISLQAPGQKPIILDYKFVGAKLTTVTVEKKELDAMIAGDSEPVAYNEVKFLDQDGEELTKPESAAIEILDANGKALDKPEAKDFKAEFVKIYTDKDGKIKEVVEGTSENVSENVVVTDAVKVLPAEGTPAGKYTIKVIAQEENKEKELKEVAKTFTVEVKEARAIKSVTVEPTTTQTTQGGKIEVLVKPVDQYGGVVAGKEDKITVQPAEVDGEKPESNFEVSTPAKPVYHNEKGEAVEGNVEGAKLVGYTVELTGKKLGEQELVFTVGKGDTAKTAKETFTVGTALDLIEAVEVLVEKEQYITADGEQEVDLKAKVTDKEGKEVKVPAGKLDWKITSVKDAKGNVLTRAENGTLTDAEGKKVDGTVTLEGNKLTVSEDLTVDVEVEVTTENNKKAKAEYTFKGDARKFVKDLALHSVNETVAEKITPGNAEVKLEAAEDGTVPTEVTLTFSGIDQYGDTFLLTDDITVKVPGATDVVDVNQKKGSVEAGGVTATTLTLKALKAGETVLFVEQGDETIEVKVTVSKEVGDKVAAITALNDAIKALPAVEDITADTLEKDKKAVEAAEKAIADAKAAKATTEAEEAEKEVKAVQAKIQELENAQQALEDAKAALANAVTQLPAEVAKENLTEAEAKVQEANNKLEALKNLDANAKEIEKAAEEIKKVQDKIDTLKASTELAQAKQDLESAIETANGKLKEDTEYKVEELNSFKQAIETAKQALGATDATVESLKTAKETLETTTKDAPAEKDERTEPELTVATEDSKTFTGLTVEDATVTVIVDDQEEAVQDGSYEFNEVVNEITVKVVYAADNNNKAGAFTITYTVSEAGEEGNYNVTKKSE